jgi:hypothetical protein
MRLFIQKLILFSFVALIAIEGYIRVNHLTNDIPRREINEDGIQLYKPNQSGFGVMELTIG